jgi:hypothetical protein
MLSPIFEKFAEKSPISIMARGMMERVLNYAVQIDQNSCSTMAPCKLLTKSDSIRVSGGF